MTEGPSIDFEALARLPLAMRERKQWLVWRFELFQGDKKPRKVPYWVSGRKRRGTQGDKDDRAELVSFDVALSILRRGTFSGLGFAFLPDDGLIGIDLDGVIDEDGVVAPRAQSIVDACGSYTELSPSGRGAHIIVQGTTATFKDNAVGIEVFCGSQFFTCSGRPWPGTEGREVVPIDEAVLRRLRATVKGPRGHKQASVPPPLLPGGPEDVRRRLEGALQVLSPEGYDDWVHVGMALKHALGDGGLALWDYWSSRSPKYPGSEALQAKWKSFDAAGAPGGITEATVFKMAKDACWRPPRAAPSASRASSSSRARAGAVAASGSPAPAQALGRGSGGGDEPPSTPTDGSAGEAEEPGGKRGRPEWMRRLITSNNGWKDCRENVYLVLTLHPKLKGLVGYDEFSHRVMKLRPMPWDSPEGEWTNNDDYFLGFWLATHINLTVKSEGTIVAGVAMAAYEARFHPVLQYLDGLPAWDEVPRLAFWLHECLGARDSEYERLVGTWFLMGMVNRVRNPGCQMDYMVVLEGLQGRRKSTALRTLVGRDEWFADTPMRLGEKDAMLSLAGKWLYEIGELDSFNKAEVTTVKQYVSSRVDRVREPFARRPVDRPRSGVFGGSTNQAEYFKDPTGARRFWPVACDGTIDLDKLKAWRDQLFAEAQHRLRSEDAELRRYYPTFLETETYLVPEQEKREIFDPWFEKLASWVECDHKWMDSLDEVRDRPSFTTYELLTKALNVPQDRIDGGRQMATRVGIAMHKMGWEKRRDADGKPRLYRYWRPSAKPDARGSAVMAGGPAGGAADDGGGGDAPPI